jgi:Mn2+/Fe2+ NRAMP family transporter
VPGDPPRKTLAAVESASSPARAEAAAAPRSLWLVLANIGPGILVMLADTDAGNVITAAQSGAQWGYRLLPLLLGLIPVLYMVQELAVRLGLQTDRSLP